MIGALRPLATQTASIEGRIVAFARWRQFQVKRKWTPFVAAMAICSASSAAFAGSAKVDQLFCQTQCIGRRFKYGHVIQNLKPLSGRLRITCPRFIQHELGSAKFRNSSVGYPTTHE